MNKVTLSIAYLFFISFMFGQKTNSQTTIVKEKNFKGIIFPADFKVAINFGAEHLNKRFTPTRQNIKTFEANFIKQINTLDNPFRVSNPKRFFKGHKRQYLGYINNKGDSIIVTQFVDNGSFFSFRRRARFSGWKNYFIICLDHPLCEKYLKLYQFNLKTEKLEIP